jgi:hypothetical protein
MTRTDKEAKGRKVLLTRMRDPRKSFPGSAIPENAESAAGAPSRTGSGFVTRTD